MEIAEHLATEGLSAPCKVCARYTDKTHVCREIRESKYGLVSVAHLYCENHCPVCNEAKNNK